MANKKIFGDKDRHMVITMWRYKFRIRDIADRYGVSYDTIVRVIRGYRS